MGMRVWAAVLLFGMGAGPAEGQAPPTPAGPMSGMDMGQSQSKDKGMNMGMSMDECKCPCMGMGGMKMEHGDSMAMDHGSGKSMDMSGMKMAMGKPVIPTGPMTVTFGEKSAQWTPATLAALPHKTLTLWNEHAKACQTYSGVPLIDLLKPLGVAEKPHGKDLRLYVAAEGADGYVAVYSIRRSDAGLARGDGAGGGHAGRQGASRQRPAAVGGCGGEAAGAVGAEPGGDPGEGGGVVAGDST